MNRLGNTASLTPRVEGQELRAKRRSAKAALVAASKRVLSCSQGVAAIDALAEACFEHAIGGNDAYAKIVFDRLDGDIERDLPAMGGHANVVVLPATATREEYDVMLAQARARSIGPGDEPDEGNVAEGTSEDDEC